MECNDLCTPTCCRPVFWNSALIRIFARVRRRALRPAGGAQQAVCRGRAHQRAEGYEGPAGGMVQGELWASPFGAALDRRVANRVRVAVLNSINAKRQPS